MLGQKGFTPIVLVLGVVVLIGVVGGVLYYRSLPHELASNPDFAQDIQESTQLDEGFKEGEGVVDFGYPENGTKITYSGKWKGAEFNEDNNYRHSVKIYYPADWEFGCCGDMDSGSGHYLDPNPLDPNPSDMKPSIIIFDFGLLGCPDGNDNCSMDQLQKVTPNKFMSNMIKNIDRDGTGPLGSTDLKKTTSVKLNNFIGDVPVYTGLSSTSQPVELYLLQSPKGVVSVEFQQPQVFDANFKMDFLNRLTGN